MRALVPLVAAPLLAVALGAALVLSVAAPPAAAQISLSGMRNSLVHFLLRQVSVEGVFEVTAEGLEQPEDGATQLVGLAIADADGVWFRAEAVALRWNARRILRGEVEINELAVRGMQVLRRPTPPAVSVPEDAEIRGGGFDPFAWPRSPIAIRVESLSFERAFVAPGVIAPQSLAFEARGAFADEGPAQTLTLAVQRTDAVAGAITLDYRRGFDDDTLRLDLAAEEAAGGLVAELAGLPPGSASRVTVAADGPLVDWDVTLSALAEAVIAVEGALTVQAAPPLRVVGGLEIRPGAALDPAVAAALGEAARLDVDVQEGADGVIRIDAARFASPALTLDLDGTYARGDGRMDFNLALAALEPLSAVIEGVDFAGFGFDGTLAGTPDDLRAVGEARLDRLATAPADVAAARLATTVTRQASGDGDVVTFSVDGRTEGLRLDRLGPDLLGAPELSVRGRWDLATSRGTLEAFTLDAPVLQVAVSGDVDVAADTAAVSYAVSAPDLGPIAAAYDLPADGAFAAEGRLDGALSAPRLAGWAELGGLIVADTALGAVRLDHDVQAPDAEAGTPLTGTVSLNAAETEFGPVSADLSLSLADEVLTLDAFTAEGLGLRLDGAITADLSGPSAEGGVRVFAPDLSPLSPLLGRDVAGAATATVTLSTPEGRQRAVVAATVDDLAGFDAQVGRAEVSATLDDLTGAPSAVFSLTAEALSAAGASLGRLTAEGRADDLTGAPSARITATAERLAAPEADATVARVTLEASGEDLLAAPSGTATLRAERIAAGDATIAAATVEAQGRNLIDAPEGTATLRVETVRAGAVSLATLEATATGRDLIAAPAGRVEATARGLGLADAAEFETLRLILDGSAQALTLEATGDGTIASGEPLSLRANGSGALAGETPQFTLARLRLAAGDAAVALQRPLTVTRAGEATRLSGLDLSLPGGALRGEAVLHPDGLAGDLRLGIEDLAPLAALADAPVAGGALDLTAQFDTRPGSATARVTLEARDVGIDGLAEEAGPLAAGLRATWNGRVASAEGEVTGDFGDPLRFTASLPVAPGLPPSVPSGARLDARLVWQGDVGALWALAPLPDHQLAGRVDLDLAIVGPLDRLEPTGRVGLSDGAYQFLETGTILTGLTVTSDLLEGGGIRLDLSAVDGAGGPVTAEVAIRGGEIAGRIDSTEAVLIRREDSTAAVTAAITIDGPLAAPLIAGDVLINRAEVRLVGGGAPNIPTLGDVQIKGEPPPEVEDEAGDGGPRLDLTIRAPRDVWVRGRGLVSEWLIDLAVRGPAASPSLTGRIERIRGELDFLGRNFDLVRGLIAFDGGAEIDPRLDIALEHERADILGRIAVRGYASEPQIAFESVPALPEDEVLPRVLFGASRQSLSGAQALQLAGGVATLLSGQEGVLGGLRSAAGLDVLSVETNGEDSAVRLGRNVADGVYVGVRQPIDGSPAAVQVEVDVFDNVTVDTETGGTGGASVGVNWRHDW